MSEKAQYCTRQITELENYLCSMEGKHVTVHDICIHFKEHLFLFQQEIFTRFYIELSPK